MENRRSIFIPVVRLETGIGLETRGSLDIQVSFEPPVEVAQ